MKSAGAVSVQAPNSLLVVGDINAREALEISAELVTVGQNQILIGTLASPDGETQVELTDDESDLEAADLTFRWEGHLDVPSNTFAVASVEHEIYLSVAVSRNVRVRVAANDDSEPDRIVIFVL